MIVREFNLKESLPFSQGYAINVIAKMVRGSLVAAGEVISGGPETGTYLYLRFTHSGDVKQSESIWFDDGYSMSQCRYKRVDAEPWETREGDGWVPVEMELTIAA